MAKLFNGSINFPSTMKPTGAQPLDDRSVVKTLVDLLSADTFGSAIYNGMMVSVVDEQKVYMLVDKTKSTQEEGWVAVGSGNGSVAVETYAEAIALATEKNIGQIIYLTKESEYDADGEEGEGTAVKYDAAPYIVIGAGELMKLAASTASGDINSEVAALKTKVSNIETNIGSPTEYGENGEVTKEGSGLVKEIEDLKAIDHEAYIDADDKLKEELQGAIDAKVAQDAYNTKMGELDAAIGGKVAQADYDAKMSELDAATTKLNTIEEGAQVNVIEVVKVNGSGLTVSNTDKSVDIIIPTAPVQGVAADEKVISLDGDKLKSTLTIAYVPASKGEDDKHIPAQLRLQGINNEVISSINADQFVKDGMIDNVRLDGPTSAETGNKYLEITWNTDSGKDVTRLDVSELFNPYYGENGIQLSGSTFSIKLATDEQYLTVGTDGLATTAALWNKVTELDNANLSAATTYANTKFEEAKNYADSLAPNYDAAGAAASAETAAKAYADETFVKVEGFNEFTQDFENKLSGIAEGAEVNVITGVTVNGKTATVDAVKNAKVDVSAIDIALGAAITGASGATIYSATTKVSTVLQGIQDSIRAAVAGGVNSVTSSDTIVDVNNADPNNPKISLKLEEMTSGTTAEGHINLVRGDNGLYGVMYYDGDDIE
jgi:hypothetical protein